VLLAELSPPGCHAVRAPPDAAPERRARGQAAGAV